MEREYEFTVVLKGTGTTREEAWEDASQAFALDPGSCPNDSCNDSSHIFIVVTEYNDITIRPFVRVFKNEKDAEKAVDEGIAAGDYTWYRKRSILETSIG